MNRFRYPRLMAVVALSLAGLAIAGCGRRGALEPPPGATDPAPPVGTPRPAPSEGERPTRPFVLDGIL